MNINILSDLMGWYNFNLLCVVLTGLWVITATLIAIGWLNKHLGIDLDSLIIIPVGIVSMLISTAVIIALGLITSPLGGDTRSRCAIISASMLYGVPIIRLIKDAIADRNSKKDKEQPEEIQETQGVKNNEH